MVMICITDLHGKGKMSASGSSEAGSLSGSDYSGNILIMCCQVYYYLHVVMIVW